MPSPDLVRASGVNIKITTPGAVTTSFGEFPWMAAIMGKLTVSDPITTVPISTQTPVLAGSCVAAVY